MPNYEYEEQLFQKGYLVVAGTDEAGRGPLAGDVFAAAVILPTGLVIDGLDDSKKLTDKKRALLYEIIKKDNPMTVNFDHRVMHFNLSRYSFR